LNVSLLIKERLGSMRKSISKRHLKSLLLMTMQRKS